MTSQCPASCWMMRGAQAWSPTRTSGVRVGAAARLGQRPEATRVIGGTTPVTFTVIRSWIQKWQELSIKSSSVASTSERSGGSRHPHHGWWPCREPSGHMKISLPVFKDEDTKDVIMYQSWCWDLTVYHCAVCWYCTLLPYIIWSLQGYLGELVRSSGMDITLDDILTILYKHYNNIKALDALNQGLFQLHMGEKETVLDWGCTCQAPTASHGIIPRMFSTRPCSWA